MALGGVVSFLACSLLFLHPIAATEVALPPILAPIWSMCHRTTLLLIPLFLLST